jgi:hypothetical protein
MRTATVSNLQIEFDLFALPPVTNVPAVPVPALFIPRIVPSNFRWPIEPEFENATPRMKLSDNMTALRLLKSLEHAKLPATAHEQSVLARYNGWGGLSLIFEPNPRDWKTEAEELKTLLTSEEYRSARATVNTSFYTPWIVARTLYQALERFGLNGGKALETSAGTGIFLAAQPPAWKLDWHCVEIDTLSGAILKHLQPDACVQVCGLQDAKLSDNGFDLVIGNVPFGDYQIHDRRLGNPLVHDYFLLRSLELVRPGGIVAVITSRGTLDKANGDIRERLAATSDLLGAIRLPETTFSRRALTTVTTDILFLQRRVEGQKPADLAWTQIGTHKTETGEIQMNRYFLDHPEMIIGRMVADAGRFGGPSCRLDFPTEQVERLESAIKRLPSGTYSPEPMVHFQSIEIKTTQEEDFFAVKEYGFAISRGSIWRKENGVARKLENIGARRGERIRGLLRIRDAARAYLDAQIDGDEESELFRITLNQAYDCFTSQHGAINLRANQLALAGDPDLPFLMALEDFDANTEKATKAPFFSQPTLDAQKEITRADTAADALIYSLHEKGRVDLEYMTQLTGRQTQSLIDELASRIFLNPESNRWETADEYLSGEVVHKLAVATKLRRPDLAVNVAALQAAQPQPLGPGEIRIKLGAPWIPAALIRQFTEDLLSQ